MTYPQTCTITEPGAAGAVDGDFGQPVVAAAAVVVYTGPCRVGAGDLRLRYSRGGDADITSGELRADQFVFLPPGEHGIPPEVDIEVTDSSVGGATVVRAGRVKRGSVYTGRFYTRLMVLWREL